MYMYMQALSYADILVKIELGNGQSQELFTFVYVFQTKVHMG